MKKTIIKSVMITIFIFICSNCSVHKIIYANETTYSGSDWTLTQDVEINGDLKVTGGVLDLAGHQLTVSGTIIHEDGIVYVDGGTIITQDYMIGEENETYGYYSAFVSQGYLRMTNPDDRVVVNGDFLMFSNKDHTGYLTAGELEVKGSFTVGQFSVFTRQGHPKNFNTSGTHKVVLSGEGEQPVELGSDESCINILEIKNDRGGTVSVFRNLPILTALVATNRNIQNSRGITLLEHAKIIGGEWNGDLTAGNGWTLEGDQGIKGKFYCEDINLNGYALTLYEDFYLDDGVVNIQLGQLNLKKNLLIHEDTTDENYEESAGYLKMVDADGEVHIDGDMIMNSYRSHENYLTDGRIFLKGDFIQKGGQVKNFYTGGQHKVILNGSGEQCVCFEHSNSEESFFNILEIDNHSNDGVHFKSDARVSKLFLHNGCHYRVDASLVLPDYDEDGIRDDEDSEPTVYDGTLPQVTVTAPINQSRTHLVGDAITIKFSKTMIEGSAFSDISLEDNGHNHISINTDLNGHVLTITPETKLNYDADYTVHVPYNAVTDCSKVHNHLEKEHVLAFASEVDSYNPIIISMTPADLEKSVAVNQVIRVGFDEVVRAGSQFDQIKVKDKYNRDVEIRCSIAGQELTIVHQKDLEYLMTYTVYLPKNSIIDGVNNGLGGDKRYSFTTILNGEAVSENIVLSANSTSNPYVGIYEYDNLTIGDHVEITSNNVSQLIIKVNGTLLLGKDATIRVRNGYYPGVPLKPVGTIDESNLSAKGVFNGAYWLYPNVYGKGGNGGNGGNGQIGLLYQPFYGYLSTNPGGDGGNGGDGGFGGGIGGFGGAGARAMQYYTTDGGRTSVAGAIGFSGLDNGGSNGANTVGAHTSRATVFGMGADGGNGNGSNGGNNIGDISRNAGGGLGGTGGGAGGYGGGVLTIIADQIVYDETAPPRFIVSGQKGGHRGYEIDRFYSYHGVDGQKGEGGLLIIECDRYKPMLEHWSLGSSEWGTHNPGANNGGHGIVTGNPGKVFINGIDCTTEIMLDEPDGDCNGDGIVDLLDVSLVLRSMGKVEGDFDWDVRADVNGDGVVDEADVAVVRMGYGRIND